MVEFATISEAYKHLSAKGVKPEFSGYGGLVDKSEILVLVEQGSEIAEAKSGQTIEVVRKLRLFMLNPVARWEIPER